MPPDSTIRGVEPIVYFNNSPDTLSSLNMKLIANAHHGGGGIKVDEIAIRENKVVWDNSIAITTNHMVDLLEPLLPHDSIKLNITWHYNLSHRPGRDGIIDSTSFYIAYFYPRVSVY